jgi:cobalt-zinc-cadmium efflux system membrane fusion protein
VKNQRKILPLFILAGLGLVVALWILRMDGASVASEGAEHTAGHSGEPSDEGHSESGHVEKVGEGHGHGGHPGQAGGEEAWESVELPDSVLARSGAALDTVRTRRMAVRLPLQGKVILNEDRAAHIHPRFPGVILQVNKQLGARVRKGEVLAVIESNESLQPYNVVSQMDGVVVNRHASAGESVTGEDELFTVADLSTVWVDFQVYRQDFNRLKRGQSVRVIAEAEGMAPAEARLGYLSPSVETHSQSLLARVELRNAGGVWTPGLFVRGEVAVEEFVSPAVRMEAVQQFPDGPVVFVREGGDRYLAHRVTLGRRDGDFVELLSDPKPGEPYVSQNSFLLKAEIGKGEASHDH